MALHELKKREKALGSNADLDTTLEYHLSDALNVCQLMEVAHSEKMKAENPADGQPETVDELDEVEDDGSDQILDNRATGAFIEKMATTSQWTVAEESGED